MPFALPVDQSQVDDEADLAAPVGAGIHVGPLALPSSQNHAGGAYSATTTCHARVTRGYQRWADEPSGGCGEDDFLRDALSGVRDAGEDVFAPKPGIVSQDLGFTPTR